MREGHGRYDSHATLNVEWRQYSLTSAASQGLSSIWHRWLLDHLSRYANGCLRWNSIVRTLLFDLLVETFSESTTRLWVLHLDLRHEFAQWLVLPAMLLEPLSIAKVQLTHRVILDPLRILLLLCKIDVTSHTFHILLGLAHLVVSHPLHVSGLLKGERLIVMLRLIIAWEVGVASWDTTS